VCASGLQHRRCSCAAHCRLLFDSAPGSFQVRSVHCQKSPSVSISQSRSWLSVSSWSCVSWSLVWQHRLCATNSLRPHRPFPINAPCPQTTPPCTGCSHALRALICFLFALPGSRASATSSARSLSARGHALFCLRQLRSVSGRDMACRCSSDGAPGASLSRFCGERAMTGGVLTAWITEHLDWGASSASGANASIRAGAFGKRHSPVSQKMVRRTQLCLNDPIASAGWPAIRRGDLNVGRHSLLSSDFSLRFRLLTLSQPWPVVNPGRDSPPGSVCGLRPCMREKGSSHLHCSHCILSRPDMLKLQKECL